MPLEGVPPPVKTCAILLRNFQPEKAHGKPGQVLPLPPSRKKIPLVRPPLNTAFRLNSHGIFITVQPAASLLRIFYAAAHTAVPNTFQKGSRKSVRTAAA